MECSCVTTRALERVLRSYIYSLEDKDDAGSSLDLGGGSYLGLVPPIVQKIQASVAQAHSGGSKEYPLLPSASWLQLRRNH